MSSVNYTGRTVDLFTLQGAEASGMRLLSPDIDFTSSKITTGIQKLAQTFITLFFTVKSSVKFDAAYGCKFMSSLSGANVNDAYLQLIFREAADDILTQMRAAVTDDTPDDEVLAAIELVSSDVPDPSTITLTVQLTTQAGTSRVYIVPITMVIK